MFCLLMVRNPSVEGWSLEAMDVSVLRNEMEAPKI
jgi:hypothetical protein